MTQKVMATDFFKWLSSNPAAANAVIIAFSISATSIVIIYVVAFFQGRNIEFWPPKIGERPMRNEETKQKKTNIAVILFLSALALSLFAAVSLQKREVTTTKDETSLLGDNNTVIKHITVDATAGFQSSGIYLKHDEKVILEPEGRVHLAAEQVDEFTKVVKGFITKNLPDGKYNDLKNDPENRLPSPDELDKIIFRRGWTGPEGENVTSSFYLGDCKLLQNKNWGLLLAVVIPPDVDVSEEPDPLKVLDTANKVLPDTVKKQSPENLLIPVPQSVTVTADYDGLLMFIINDAVISPLSPSSYGRDYHAALKQASNDLRIRHREDYQRIPESSIPLVWYADNLGSFRVTVKHE